MSPEECTDIELLSKLVMLQGADNVIVFRHPRNGVPSGQFALSVLPKLLDRITALKEIATKERAKGIPCSAYGSTCLDMKKVLALARQQLDAEHPEAMR